MCDLSGRVTRQWTLHRVNDLAISADGQKIIVVASDSSIQILRLRDHVPVGFENQGLGSQDLGFGIVGPGTLLFVGEI